MQSFDIQPYLWARERESAGCNIVLLGPSLISTAWSDCRGAKSPSVCQLMSLLLIDTRGPPSAESPIPTLLSASLSTGGSGTHASDQGGDAGIWSLLGEEVYTQVIKVAMLLHLGGSGIHASDQGGDAIAFWGEVVYTQVIKVATPLYLGGSGIHASDQGGDAIAFGGKWYTHK